MNSPLGVSSERLWRGTAATTDPVLQDVVPPSLVLCLIPLPPENTPPPCCGGQAGRGDSDRLAQGSVSSVCSLSSV